MKIFLMILTTFYFLGCGESSSESETMNGVGFGGSGAVFTITHKATTHEPVQIFLKDEIFDKVALTSLISGSGGGSKAKKTAKPYSGYFLEPNDCLTIRESQFDNLIVLIGVGWGSDESGLSSSYIACGGLGENEDCQAQNYNIIDKGSVWDDFVMVPVEISNPSECVAIEEWMESKKTKTPEPTETQNTEEVTA